ncbi:hypothetical protein ACP275_08G066400 [Erythranthe tilingii]
MAFAGCHCLPSLLSTAPTTVTATSVAADAAAAAAKPSNISGKVRALSQGEVRDILRTHSHVWKDSHYVEVATLTSNNLVRSLRPGDFDRHVTVDRLDVARRVKILQSAGFTRADLQNLMNEAQPYLQPDVSLRI